MRRNTPRKRRPSICGPLNFCRLPSKPRTTPPTITCSWSKFTPSKPARNSRSTQTELQAVVRAEILARAQFPYSLVTIVRTTTRSGTLWISGRPDGRRDSDRRAHSLRSGLPECAGQRPPYRRALPLGKAMEMVAEQSGRSFDPRVVEVLQRRHVELEQMARGSQAETFSLSTDIKIERGAAPAAGFAEAGDSSATSQAPAASVASGWGALVDLLENPAGVLSRKQAVAIFADQLQELIPSDGIGFDVRADDTLLPEYARISRRHAVVPAEIGVGDGLSGWVAANGKTTSQRKSRRRRRSAGGPEISARHSARGPERYRRGADAFSRASGRVLAGRFAGPAGVEPAARTSD